MCDGRTVNGVTTPNLTGRFLQGWGWDDFYARGVGEYIQEGLPNITGQINAPIVEEGSLAYGSFYQHEYYSPGAAPLPGAGDSGIAFNANLSHWIYGNAYTVQPRSYVVYYIIKIDK